MNGLENHEDSLNNAIAHSVLKINPKVSFFDASKASKKSFKITKKTPKNTLFEEKLWVSDEPAMQCRYAISVKQIVPTTISEERYVTLQITALAVAKYVSGLMPA